MSDIREIATSDDIEEAIRAALDAHRKQIWTAMPIIVEKDSDGHTVTLKMSIKGQVRDEKGKLRDEEYPVLQDVPIHFVGGGGDKEEKSVLLTHPIKKKDEGFITFMSRPMDTWFKDGDVQGAIDRRSHDLSDAIISPGVRSTPRKIKHYDDKTAQLRSGDKKHVISHDPEAGTTIRSVKEAENKDDDPFEKPKEYYGQHIKASVSFLTEAVKDKKKHKHELTHKEGHVIDANNGRHKTTVHPDNGAALSAENGKHKVEALTNKVALTSSTKNELTAPQNDVNGNTNIKGDTDIQGNTNISGNTNIGGQLSAALASFGGFGSSGGGSVGGDLGVGGNMDATGRVSGEQIQTEGVLVGDLPPASPALAGARRYVKDADAPVFLGTLTGGGSVVCPVFCNGAAWVPG